MKGRIVCPDCANHCRLKEGEIGFCHNRQAIDGKVKRIYEDAVPVSWYFDPLPTNCVADWVCPMNNRTKTDDGQRLKNLAVFYGSCNSDCLFCQNSSYKEMMRSGKPLLTPDALSNVADDCTACVCYFGGDPSCNPYHSLKTSLILFDRYQMPICYETNGKISSKWLGDISDIVKRSGGTIKFDLKAITPLMYRVLTGSENTAVIKNFKKLARMGRNRESEFLVASILLVPGYINLAEVESMCDFIAECDSSIPTALLGFAPRYYMSDLPRTSRTHAKEALRIAHQSGLKNVRVGNNHLLSNEEYLYD